MNDYDIAFIGQYTKDTIINSGKTEVKDGGAYYFGSNAAARMGLRTAAVTRLAKEDFSAPESLEKIGVKVFAIETKVSTCLRLEYTSANPDERKLTVTSVAEPFTAADVEGIDAAVWSVGASLRGEIGLEVLKALVSKGSRLGLDVQGYVRILKEGTIAHDPWPEKVKVLKYVDVLKADILEAGILTGKNLAGTEDLKKAALELKDFGPKELVLTHKDGVVVYAEGKFFEAPFLPKKLVGRSGRGDTCLAAYLAKRLSHGPREATTWAAALTTIKLESPGPFSGTVEDIEKKIREFY